MMPSRRSARILAAQNDAANRVSTAAQPSNRRAAFIRRAAFMRAVEAIPLARRRTGTTITGNQRVAYRPPTVDHPGFNYLPSLRYRFAIAFPDDDLPNFFMGFADQLTEQGPDIELPLIDNPNNTNIGLRRLRREMEKMTSDPTDGCKVELVDDSIYYWRAIILGPSETPYEGGHFELFMRFPRIYPSHAPSVQFRTKIYHCNILHDAICIDILGVNWSPVLTVEKLLLSIRSLLADPNPDSPLNVDAANMYKNDREQHDRLAREWTALYAKPVASPFENS